MPQVWAWFHEPSRVLALVEEVGGVSVLLRDPKMQDDVVVMGPVTRDMACYPFLDVPHQIRRFGMRRHEAEHYVRILQTGGAVVYIDNGDPDTKSVLDHLEARDILM